VKTHTHCTVCGKSHPLLAETLGLCPACARTEAGLPQARLAHAASRRLFDLPEAPPRTAGGVQCVLCGCECLIGEGERGFCGLRTVREGKLRHTAGTPRRGLLHWYRDPLPTNCVADWVCRGSAQRGKHNLAVFYNSCTLDCLYCQNWHFRQADLERQVGMSAQALAVCANPRTFCVCYFGGDPASQMPHALASAKRLAERGVVVCWETAGTSHPRLLDRAVRLSLETGGCIKFDLKAFTEPLHVALTGWSNQRILANFARAASRFHERPDPPLVIASTLLVPGYVDVGEVGRIARFIAQHNPDIPYSLLGFAPNYLMPDLPPTSVRHAEAARQVALVAGVRHVRLGNRHLLGHDY
jgi:pyruvate formate lyase activating enzyme